MSMFQRLVERATVSDDYNDDFDDEFLEDENVVEAETEGEVVAFRAVDDMPQHVDLARIVTVWPSSYGDLKEFADPYREGVPVILNLSHASEDARPRIIDFASGVCYGLGGNLNSISHDVVLMTPKSVKMEDHRTERDR